jgi:hypothetical protein
MKCYITDDNKRLTIDAVTKVDAAMKFIDYFKNKGIMLGKQIMVSEVGFNDVVDTDSIFCTDSLLKDVA